MRKILVGVVVCKNVSPFLLISSLLFCFTTTSCNRSPQTNLERAQSAAGRASSSTSDGVRLHSYEDRENFRRWFTAIAEMQFYRISDMWNTDQQDCAGCIRFAWREALRSHDHAWFRKMGDGYEPWAPDVHEYTLGNGPHRDKLFRTTAVSIQTGSPTPDAFSDFADAQTLLKYNCTFVSRDRQQALPGDLLFFHQPWTQKYPYHVMLFLGTVLYENQGAGDWVVYHTGASPADGGTVKKVRLAVLDHHPDKRWRPIERNPNFLGFYRLHILQ